MPEVLNRPTRVLTAGVVDGFRQVAIDALAGDDLTAMLAGVAGR